MGSLSLREMGDCNSKGRFLTWGKRAKRGGTGEEECVPSQEEL